MDVDRFSGLVLKLLDDGTLLEIGADRADASASTGSSQLRP
jgi:hypothetical protein